MHIDAPTAELVRSLAIRYNAYQDANNASDKSGIYTWGKMLIEVEDALGIRIGNRQTLEANIKSADRVLQLMGDK